MCPAAPTLDVIPLFKKLHDENTSQRRLRFYCSALPNVLCVQSRFSALRVWFFAANTHK